MNARTAPTPQFASPTRLDVTDCAAARIEARAEANQLDDAELYLERRGGKTFLVAKPTGR